MDQLKGKIFGYVIVDLTSKRFVSITKSIMSGFGENVTDIDKIEKSVSICFSHDPNK